MNTQRLIPFALALAALAPATPALHADPAAPADTRDAAPSPAYVGVELMPVDAPSRALFKLPPVGGLLVFGVGENSPAAGKLGQGDILLKLGDQTLVNREQLRALIRAHRPGTTVDLTVIRGGRTETVRITLAAIPAPAPAAARALPHAADLLTEMREHTRRALRDTGHPESLLDATDDVIVLSPSVKESKVTAVARTVLKPEGAVTIIRRDGKTCVTVKDQAGKTLADGELDDGLRATLPSWARDALEDPPAKP